MNKQNLGYRLGKWYRKFRQWQHPTPLKWAYVLITTGIVVPIFWELFLWIFIITFGLMVVTRYSVSGEAEQRNDYDGWRSGYDGCGYYVGGVRVDKVDDDD